MQDTKSILFLSRQDVKKVNISMKETIKILEDAFMEKGNLQVEMPPKFGIHPGGDAFMDAMPCWIPRYKAAGIKWISYFPQNDSRGLGSTSGLLILNDPDTGYPTAIIDSSLITSTRTGAVSGLSAKYLSHPGSRTVGIIGCGVQGRASLTGIMSTCHKINRAICYDLNPSQSDLFIEDMQDRFPIEFLKAATPQSVVTESDIVVTATTITRNPQPVIEAGWIKEGQLSLPVDYSNYWKPEVYHQADAYFVDDLQQYHYTRSRGSLKNLPDPMGDLGELLTNKIRGRLRPSERIICMNMGIAMNDMATAIQVYQRAAALGLGIILNPD
jgi:ornithine cyclodeaminase/alanine dehydrogenase-like protein (mu-crystallin family)